MDAAQTPYLSNHWDAEHLRIMSHLVCRKLLDAIDALRDNASGKTPSVDARTTSGTPSVLQKTVPNAAKSL